MIKIVSETIDSEGNICPLANNEIELKLTGPGTIIGVGNGNPQSLNPFQSTSVPLSYGKAMVIIRSDFDSGTLTLEASSKGLEKAAVSVKVE